MKTILACLLFPLSLPAQELTGVWTGFIVSGENKLPYEVAISSNDNELSGFAMTVFSFHGVKNVGLKTIRIKEKKGKIIIEDDKLLYDNYTTTAKRVVLNGRLELNTRKNSFLLSGPFTTRYVDMRERGKPGYSGTIELTKKIDEGPSEILGVLHELDLLNTLSFLAKEKKENSTPATDPTKIKIRSVELEKETTTLPSTTLKNLPEMRMVPRTNQIIKQVDLRSDSLSLTLFDNGEVDGDTVTVLLNGKVLMNKIGLTAKPVKQTVYFTPGLGDSILIVLYAENLGIYPPNTGLLIIEDGFQRSQVNFTGDFQKNSAILLRRKK